MGMAFRTLHRHLLKGPFSAEDVKTIHQELDAILASNHFRNSKRYPAFLTYIVETSLQGKSEEIKERNIGVEAFGRPADYDTNLDPIVRNTASEVRKRIALYYAELPSGESRAEISLLPGSYVPEFYVPDPAMPAEAIQGPADSAEAALPTSHPPLPSHLVEEPAGEPHPHFTDEHVSPPKKERLGPLRLLGIFLLVISVGALAWYGWRLTHPTQALWADFFSTRHEVLIVVPEAPPPGNTSVNWVRDNPDVALEDLTAILPPTGVLMEHHVPFNVKLDPAVTLADMTNRPIILIGGPTNKWTVTLTESLRYRMKKDAVALSIEDTQKASSSVCTYQTNADGSVLNDCALIARFHSLLTGNTVIVIAGTGRNGTEAAGEWITSPGLDAKLSELFPDGWQNKNLEIALKTTVIDGKNGAPAVVSAYRW